MSQLRLSRVRFYRKKFNCNKSGGNKMQAKNNKTSEGRKNFTNTFGNTLKSLIANPNERQQESGVEKENLTLSDHTKIHKQNKKRRHKKVKELEKKIENMRQQIEKENKESELKQGKEKVKESRKEEIRPKIEKENKELELRQGKEKMKGSRKEEIRPAETRNYGNIMWRLFSFFCCCSGSGKSTSPKYLELSKDDFTKMKVNTLSARS